ncbi:MAG: serine/threonine-protein kinase [bacterium]
MKKPIPFGKYYLLERINVGGMAEVFKAKAFGVEGFERLLAVKRILPNIAEDEEFITMFIDEAKIAVQLNHANIAQIFDLGKVDDSYFIALEFIHGKDLRGIFDRCRASGENMPIAQACFIIMKVCEGLDYAHNKRDASGREIGLVHRDVSPQNVLLSYEGEVKVIDFGIAKAAGKASKTQAGILKGKFGYMSPEQVRGLPLTRGSDIFSVGIVLYELLTGERLFIGESDFSTLEKVRNVEILPPSTYNRKIPEELERIVLKTLSKDPEDRYQHAIDLHDELQAFMYTAGEFYSRKDLSAWMKRTWSREIQEETKKLEEYRHLQPPAPSAAPAGGGLPPPARAPNAAFSAASVSSAAAEPDLDWDDDEIETQLYDREEDEDPFGQAAAPPAPARRVGASPRSTLMGMGALQPPSLPSPGGSPGLPAPRGGLPSLPAPRPATEPIMDPFAPPMGQPERHLGLDDVMPAVDHGAPVAAPSDLASRRKSGGGRVALILVSVLLILGASGGALWYFLLRSKPQGSLTVRCAKAGCTIRVDEQKTSHASPFTTELSPGPHMITLKAPGYKTLVKEVEIKAGKALEIEPPLVQAVVSKGWFNLISAPSGSEVLLDGQPLAQKTDIRVEVAVGPHSLQLRRAGYYPWPLEKPHNFDVKPGENPQIKRILIPRRLQLVISASNVRRGAAKFSVYKDGAKILAGTVPKTIAIKQVDPNASYRVIIRAKSYPDWSKKLAFDGSDEISVHAPFSSKSVAVMPVEPMHPEPVYMRPVYMQPVYMRPVYMRPVERPVEPRGTGGKFGILRINTIPWTTVYVDGSRKGNTPLLKLKLTAGRHKLVLLNNNFGIRKTFWITIRPGKPTTFIRRFQKPAP